MLEHFGVRTGVRMAFQQHRTVTAAARLLGPAILVAAATLGGSAIGTPAVAPPRRAR